MKRNTLLCKTITSLCLVLFSLIGKAQTFGFNVTPLSQCFNGVAAFPFASATGAPAETNSYSWSISGPCSLGIGGNLSSTGFSLTCPGVYTVNCLAVGANTSIILGSATGTFVVLPSPTINVTSQAPGYACEGSTISYTASGAPTFTWNTGANTPTLNVIAGSFANYVPGNFAASIYTVSGSFANGCVGSATVSPWQQTFTCSIVWPGDANRDGIVSNLDVLELGLANNSTGLVRASATNSWVGQYVTNWTGTVSTGWNKSHADCNGDGVINNNDQVAISNNFSLSHSFRESLVELVNPDILLVPQTGVVYYGSWSKIDIMLGSATNNQSQLCGLAFDLNYDQSLIQTDSIKVVYPSSFLNVNNQTIDFRKLNFANGKVYCATVRTDHANISGNGKIAELWYKVKSGSVGSVLNFSASNGTKINVSGVTNTLSSASATSLTIGNAPLGIKTTNVLENFIGFYPNPTNSIIYLANDAEESASFGIFDITGREILKGEFEHSKSLDLSSYENGTYIIQFKVGEISTHKKLIIEKN